jgi:hypothetical protein
MRVAKYKDDNNVVVKRPVVYKRSVGNQASSTIRNEIM